ncbi:MAG: aminotransferase class V-fold PLP-dependent enzyme [Pseudoflavonifractor sp.]
MIYLDSAATTLQKPAAVLRAAQYAMSHMASPGRGGHRPAMQAADTAFACRQAAAELFHVGEPERVVLTFNATHGLNLAIKSVVKPGDTVLISGYEHNAVLRPLACMEGVQLKIAASPLFEPEAMYRRFEELLTPEVTAVVCNHVSNVFGYLLPAERIAALCKARAVPFILDASQSAGCVPLSMEELGAAFIAMPGHKGLYGPQGTGLLLCGDVLPVPLLEGGTGSLSALRTMPEFLPDRVEAGTPNIPGVAGLLAGIRFVRQEGERAVLNHERILAAQAADGLERIDRVRVFAADDMARQTGVLSFQIGAMDCETVGEALGEMGIAVRAGLHCAALAHESAGTLNEGTVRASFSAFNTPREVERFLCAVRQIAGGTNRRRD